ncbi:heterokaryon incompatibility protein-domain-containing protein [Nemania sp. NC0429]|nr:heterokaryon incompatibility protein-domain-containing protein [Nemania sp. NC0429]
MPLYDDLPLKGNEIRLLKVSPAASDDDDAPVCCKLEVIGLDTTSLVNSYYAVSYTWGAPAAYGEFRAMTNARTHPVNCNGHVIHVSENLHCFLRRLRAMPKLADNRFWIDAICINQDGNATEERAGQIQQMGRIFSSAMTVITWLGEEDKYTEKSFSMLKKLADPSIQKLIRSAKSLDTDYAEGLLSVVRLFQRTYFTRAWIVQEIVLAARVVIMCGKHEIDWNVVAEASHMFSTTGFRDYLNTLPFAPAEAEVNFSTPAVLRAIARDRPGSSWTKTLLQTLIRTRNFRSSHSQDKVCCLLGLIEQDITANALLSPDYYLQSAETSYTNTAIQILEKGEDLLLLTCVEGDLFQHPGPGESMASWVPDWREDKGLGLRGTGYARYCAAGRMTQRPAIDRSALTLTLKGIKLDHITMTGEAKHEVVRSRRRSFAGWLRILCSLPTLYHGVGQFTGAESEHRMEAFWRTLIANTGGNITSNMLDKSTSLAGSFAQWFMETEHHGDHELLSVSDMAWLSEMALKSGVLEQSSHEFSTAVAHGKHLRLFRTGNGYLGLGSESLRDGDEVWVVPGSPVPLIYRTVGGGNRYRLVGGTYLHGFMNGEAVDPLICGVSTGEIEKKMEQVIII